MSANSLGPSSDRASVEYYTSNDGASRCIVVIENPSEADFCQTIYQLPGCLSVQGAVLLHPSPLCGEARSCFEKHCLAFNNEASFLLKDYKESSKKVMILTICLKLNTSCEEIERRLTSIFAREFGALT